MREVGGGEREQAVALAQVARAHVRGRDLGRVRAREPARLAVARALAVVPACGGNTCKAFSYGILVKERTHNYLDPFFTSLYFYVVNP